jgi:MFS family permease
MTTAILSYLPAALLAERAEKKPWVVLTYLFFTLFPLAVVLAHSFAALAAAYVIGGLREIGEPARKSLIVDLAVDDPGRTVGLYYSIRGFAVAGGGGDRRRPVDDPSQPDLLRGRSPGRPRHPLGRRHPALPPLSS